jgi:hypothetical protein
MNDIRGCAAAWAPRDGSTSGAHAAAARVLAESQLPGRRVLVAPGRGGWDLVTILLLRAAQPELAVELVRRPASADRIAAAFREGADAYVVGCGDTAVDRRFIQEACGVPPFAPVG